VEVFRDHEVACVVASGVGGAGDQICDSSEERFVHEKV
jgi:hypothetical protein